MKKKKLIIDIVGTAMEKHDFIYDSSLSANMMWCFTKNVNQIKQTIYIQDHRFAKGLFLRFQTNTCFRDAIEFIPRDTLPPLDETGKIVRQTILDNPTAHFPEGAEADLSRLDYGSYWSYENEETFVQTLAEFVELIEQYGLAELERMSNQQ